MPRASDWHVDDNTELVNLLVDCAKHMRSIDRIWNIFLQERRAVENGAEYQEYEPVNEATLRSFAAGFFARGNQKLPQDWAALIFILRSAAVDETGRIDEEKAREQLRKTARFW